MSFFISIAGEKPSQLHQSGRGLRFTRERFSLFQLDPGIPRSHRHAHQSRRQATDQEHYVPRRQRFTGRPVQQQTLSGTAFRRNRPEYHCGNRAGKTDGGTGSADPSTDPFVAHRLTTVQSIYSPRLDSFKTFY